MDLPARSLGLHRVLMSLICSRSIEKIPSKNKNSSSLQMNLINNLRKKERLY